MKSTVRAIRRAAKQWLMGPSEFCVSTCIVSDEQKVMFAYVPKAGCTSIKTWLLRHGGFSHEFSKQSNDAEACGSALPDAHAFMRSHFLLRRRSQAEIMRVLNDSSYYKFCCVRNPLPRLVSAYLSKVVTNNPTAYELIVSGQVTAGYLKPATLMNWARGIPLDPDRGLTFREFVHSLKTQNPMWLDSHFRAQDRLLRGLNFNVIVHLENIQEDFLAVRRHLGVDIPLPQRNATIYRETETTQCVADSPAAHFRNQKAPHWRCFFDAALQSDCEQFYADDFERFGYQIARSTIAS